MMLPRTTTWLAALLASGVASAAEVQPLSIDLFDSMDAEPGLERGTATGAELSWDLEIELLQQFRYGSDAEFRRSTMEVAPSVAFDAGERTEVRLGARALLNHNSARAESTIEVDETYVRQRLTDNLTLSFGRQVVAWGSSDFFHGAQLTDVVNPRDFREPALMDLEDARLPVLLSRLHRVGKIELEAVVTHERRAHRFDGAGGDFDLFGDLRAQGIDVGNADKGLTAVGDWYVRASKQIGNGDLAVVVGQRDQDDPALTLAFGPNGPVAAQEHPRHTLAGVSWSHAIGSSVLKMEHALALDKAVNRDNLQSFASRDTLQSMIGVDYFGFNDWVLTFEVTNEHIFAHTTELAQPDNGGHASALVRWAPARRDIEFNLVLLQAFPHNARIARFETVARLNDHFKLKFGAIDYRVSDPQSFYASFENQDRLYSSIEFTL